MAELELEAVREYLGRNRDQPGPVEVGAALRSLGLLVSDAVVRQTVAALRRESIGAGVLDPLLHEPGVTDVVVNAPATRCSSIAAQGSSRRACGSRVRPRCAGSR